MKTISLYLIICIILFGVSTFFRKLALDRLHPFQLQIISGIIYMILMPLWLYLLHQKEIIEYDSRGVMYAVVCVFIYTGATVLFSFALKETKSPGAVAALVSLSPIITISLAFFFLDEKFTVTKAIALLLALGSAILVNF